MWPAPVAHGPWATGAGRKGFPEHLGRDHGAEGDHVFGSQKTSAAGAWPFSAMSSRTPEPVQEPRVPGMTRMRPAMDCPASGWWTSITRPVAGSTPPQKLSGSVVARMAPSALRQGRSGRGRSFHDEAVGEGIAVVDEDGCVAGHPRPSGDRGDDASRPATVVADSTRPLKREPMMDSCGIRRRVQLPPCRKLGHAGRGAGAAGRAVDRLVAVKDGVSGVCAGHGGLAGPQDVAEPADGGVFGVGEVVLRVSAARSFGDQPISSPAVWSAMSRSSSAAPRWRRSCRHRPRRPRSLPAPRPLR